MTNQLSQSTIQIIQDSAFIVSSSAIDISSKIYEILFLKYPQMKQLFKNAPSDQHKVLAEAISAYAVNIDKLQIFKPALKIIADNHVRTNVQAMHYPILGTVFIESLEIILGDFATIKFVDAWREAFKFLSNILIDMEKEIYEELK